MDLLRILLILCFFFGGKFQLFAQQELSEKEKEIVFDWKVYAVSETPDQEKTFLNKNAFFHIKEDHTFSYSILVGEKKLTNHGLWQLNNDQLTLYYELLPISSSIDSIKYGVEDNEGIVSYYAGGKIIATLNKKGLESERRTEVLQVSYNERGFPELEREDLSIFLSGKPILLRSAFSLMDVLRALIGILAMVAIAWLLSSNRKAINWKLVSIGIGFQLVIAVLVLKWWFVRIIFEWLGSQLQILFSYTNAGTEFLFGNLVADSQTFGIIVALNMLPVIIFFSALTAILYYLGILQKIVFLFAQLLRRTMNLSGAESLAAAGNIFVGQTEAPLLVRPYLEKMSRSEIMALMTGGFSTIAGSVFAAYVVFLGGDDVKSQGEFATHLLTASIMSAPAALVIAKILVPEEEEINEDMTIPKDQIGSNLLDAIANGTTDGLKLAVNVGVMLLVFTALVAMLNGFTAGVIGQHTGLNEVVNRFTDGTYSEFNLQFIFGILFAPVAWLIGIPSEDIMISGQLLGEKMILNEFFAYASLSGIKEAGQIVHYKSLIILTYALCGFANLASIGIQIGGIGALAPGQRKTLSALGIKSMIGGTIACLMTGTIAGMLVLT